MLRAGEQEPAFDLLDLRGRRIALAGFAGRKVLAYFDPTDPDALPAS